jgi:hypothetical protein
MHNRQPARTPISASRQTQPGSPAISATSAHSPDWSKLKGSKGSISTTAFLDIATIRGQLIEIESQSKIQEMTAMSSI